MLSEKIDLIGTFIEEYNGHDFFDRYLRPSNVFVYIFERDRQRYVWQSEARYTGFLIEGQTYHIKAKEGRRLLGGRGTSISEVEFF